MAAGSRPHLPWKYIPQTRGGSGVTDEKRTAHKSGRVSVLALGIDAEFAGCRADAVLGGVGGSANRGIRGSESGRSWLSGRGVVVSDRHICGLSNPEQGPDGEPCIQPPPAWSCWWHIRFWRNRR